MKTHCFKKIALILCTPFIMVSCFNNDTETEPEIFNDAYLIKKMVGTEAQYAVAFYAYGNLVLSSGTVTEVGGSGTQINLGMHPSSVFTLSKIPAASDYKPYPPANTEYKFKITTSTGATIESTDKLTVQNLATPTITKIEFSENKKLVNVVWTAVPKADGYVVKVADKDGVYIFSSEGFAAGVTNCTLNLLTGNWTKTMDLDETYTIQVHAFMYETNTDDLYNIYNVEEISIDDKPIFWE